MYVPIDPFESFQLIKHAIHAGQNIITCSGLIRLYNE